MANKTLAGLKPNPKNPRKITDAKARMLRDSLARFGDLSGLVYNRTSGQLVGGHQRVDAFRALGADDVTITETYTTPSHAGTVAEGHVDISGERYAYREVQWDEATEKAANLAANKGAGEWDLAQVAEWVGELADINFDLDLTMFDADERDALTPAVQVLEECDGDDDIADPPADPTTKLGDLYILGKHRLLCGSSTNAQDVDRLLGGVRVNLTFTSPPYNAAKNTHLADRVAGFENKYSVGSDALDDDDYVNLLIDFTALAIAHSDYVLVNLQLLTHNRMPLLQYQSHYASMMKDILIWNKSQCPPNIVKGAFNTKWEYIFCLSQDTKTRGFPCTWQGQFPNVVDTSSNSSNVNADDHRAGFPIALPAWFLEKFVFAKVIYDPFMGTGTTLCCAEQFGRTCFGMELNPYYVDLAVSRWEKLTGEQAKLISSGGEASDGG